MEEILLKSLESSFQDIDFNFYQVFNKCSCTTKILISFNIKDFSIVQIMSIIAAMNPSNALFNNKKKSPIITFKIFKKSSIILSNKMNNIKIKLKTVEYIFYYLIKIEN